MADLKHFRAADLNILSLCRYVHMCIKTLWPDLQFLDSGVLNNHKDVSILQGRYERHVCSMKFRSHLNM